MTVSQTFFPKSFQLLADLQKAIYIFRLRINNNKKILVKLWTVSLTVAQMKQSGVLYSIGNSSTKSHSDASCIYSSDSSDKNLNTVALI